MRGLEIQKRRIETFMRSPMPIMIVSTLEPPALKRGA